METLTKICETLNCGIIDVIELASDEPSSQQEIAVAMIRAVLEREEG